MNAEDIPYLHPMEDGGEALPERFTYPFRYTPHALCRRAALVVQEKLKEMGVTEGKMYGVLVVKTHPLRDAAEGNDCEGLYFLAAYSGQLNRGYAHPWFVPPVVDYLAPDSYFQREQREIMALGQRMAEMRESEERKAWQQQVQQLSAEREAAVLEAKRIYNEGKDAERGADYIRLRQFQKANIHRAKQLHREEIAELEGRLAALNTAIHALYEERKQRSEALQQWLFEQFEFLNARGEKKGLRELFFRPTPAPSHKGGEGAGAGTALGPSVPEAYADGGQGERAGAESANGRPAIPSGAGECCAPKLLQAAYRLGLRPIAMAEFWWGPSKPGHYHEQGAFYPACRSKCYPILTHMLEGLNVEPDPALHYDNKVLAPVRVVWEDEHLAVIAKPEGWCSIPGRSDQANLYDEAHRLWPDIEGSVIVHRLDQDTSGVMVIAKNARVHHALSQQFERREVKKRYVALLSSPLPSEGGAKGTISLPLAPDIDNLPRQQVDHECGKEAVTLYEVLGTEEHAGQQVTRIVFYPQTGRTHQLRVHAASPEGLNAPILGDRLYGQVSDRLYLHAEAIAFMHPVTHAPMHFELPAPF